MFRIGFGLLVIIYSSLANIVFGQSMTIDNVQVGRYSTVPAEPLPEQINLLDAMVTMDFPQQNINTVGAAVHYLLKQSGYRLAEPYASDPAVQILLTRPLPEAQRHLGPCPLEDALTTLAGPVYRLVVDPLHRLVSFDVAEKYRALVATVRPATAASMQPVTLQRTRYRQLVPDKMYGPVRKNETLLPIAIGLRKQIGATTEQIMLALLNNNPAAFGRIGDQPNINLLRTGVMLKLPNSAVVSQWPSTQAKQEISRQGQQWKAYRDNG